MLALENTPVTGMAKEVIQESRNNRVAAWGTALLVVVPSAAFMAVECRNEEHCACGV